MVRRKWFEKQLHAGLRRPTPASPACAAGGTRPVARDAEPTLWDRQKREIEGGWEVMANYARWALLRRIRSRRQVHEMMAEFWENHFNVPVNGDAAFTWRTDYGIRHPGHALGSFEDLLRATILHPAMGIYLDNAVSTKAAPNENLGRELLELHTVGRAAGYTEDDVKNSARILTGYRVDMWHDFSRRRTSPRTTGPARSRCWASTHANADADGRSRSPRTYLDYLAHHPATAAPDRPQARA